METISSDPQKLITAVENSRKALKCAIRNGVTIIAGTDIGMVGDKWGSNAQEVELYVKAGMTPLEAIECIMANGPLAIGKYRCPLKGQVKVGYVADLLGVAKNPLSNFNLGCCRMKRKLE